MEVVKVLVEAGVDKDLKSDVSTSEGASLRDQALKTREMNSAWRRCDWASR